MGPPEFVGLTLVVLAVFLLLLEVKVPGFGVLGVAGAVALVAGLVMLLGLTAASLPLLVALALPLIALFAFLAVLAHGARRRKVVTGDAGMVGLEGRAESALMPEGKVFVRGELWDAWSPVRLERGAPVRVTGVRGLRLEVTAVSPEHAIPSSVSAALTDGGHREGD
jgi:membrane-bound serine protease (ClpP class)